MKWLQMMSPQSLSAPDDPERSQRFAEIQALQDRQKREDQMDEAKIRKRDQMLAVVQQEILMSGVTLSAQEMKDLFDAIVALVETATPEAGRHITAFLERLGQHTQKTSKLRDGRLAVRLPLIPSNF